MPQKDKPSVPPGPWGEEPAFGPTVAVASEALGLKMVRRPLIADEKAAKDSRAGEGRDLEKRMAERLNLHDFSGALSISEEILKTQPGHAGAVKANAECKKALEAMYWSHLGEARAVPGVKIAPDEVIWLGLDHRAGFVLSQIDGVSSYEEIIEVSGMERAECLRILAQLVQAGVIGPIARGKRS